MKTFISSVIAGLEDYRDAADHASRTLGHEVIRAEQFGASSESPQRTCLAGVREADIVLLILGTRYGAIQDSGMSATEEEYMEARDRIPILIFVQDAEIEERQRRFLETVQHWASGTYTASFRTKEELTEKMIRHLHDHEIATAAGPVDEEEVLERALSMLPADRGSFGRGSSLVLAVAGAPRQQVLRPSELEQEGLRRDIMQEATLDEHAVLDLAQGTEVQLDGSRLLLTQRESEVVLDEGGNIRISIPATTPDPDGHGNLPVLVEEDVVSALRATLIFCGRLLDFVDPLRRLTDLAVVAEITDGGYLGWRTKQERQANPSSVSINPAGERGPVHLEPPVRKRAALQHDRDRIAEDLMTLLRRQYR